VLQAQLKVVYSEESRRPSLRLLPQKLTRLKSRKPSQVSVTDSLLVSVLLLQLGNTDLPEQSPDLTAPESISPELLKTLHHVLLEVSLLLALFLRRCDE